MRTFKYTIANKDEWSLTDEIVIIVAENKKIAKELLVESGYVIEKTNELIEIKKGAHLIQNMLTQ